MKFIDDYKTMPDTYNVFSMFWMFIIGFFALKISFVISAFFILLGIIIILYLWQFVIIAEKMKFFDEKLQGALNIFIIRLLFGYNTFYIMLGLVKIIISIIEFMDFELGNYMVNYYYILIDLIEAPFL